MRLGYPNNRIERETNTIENLVKRLDKIEKDNTDIQDKLGKALAKEGW